MDMREMVIEVNGLPDNYHEDTMIDKLTMHFLRRDNMGGDVLKVLYPTSNKGQAFVVFESEEVPGVLEHTHVLEVKSQFYPLNVKRADQPLLDMHAEAFLDLNLFSNHKNIQKVLDAHGFQVSQTRSGQLHLQGSFLKLQLVYHKLMQLLAQEMQFHSKTPSCYTNGFLETSPKTRKYDCKSNSNVTLRKSRKNASLEYEESRSTSLKLNIPKSQDKMAFLHTTSEDSSSEGSFSSFSKRHENAHESHLHKPNSTSARKVKTSFHAEQDAMEYILHFKEDSIEQMKSDYQTDISYDSGLEPGIVEVKCSGDNCEEAIKKLGKLVEKISLLLRTQEIDLKLLDTSQKRVIIQKAEMVQRIYRVLIKKKGNVIKIVGLSKDSYDAMQKLLGHDVDTASPKPMERNLLRRSSSLPRQQTRAKMDNREIQPKAVVAEASSSSSSSHYQMDSKLQQEVQQERGRALSKSDSQRCRAQSATRSKVKSQIDSHREQLNDAAGKSETLKDIQVVNQKPKFLSALGKFDVKNMRKNLSKK